MTSILRVGESAALAAGNNGLDLPALVANGGERAQWRFVDYFTSSIRNANTRAAYYRAVMYFLGQFEASGFRDLTDIRSLHVSQYVEMLAQAVSVATVKQHLAAIRRFCDWMTSGGILDVNPAAAVRGPKYVVRRGKTPVLDGAQSRELLDSLPRDTIAGLRDRALLGTMLFTFGRVGAVVAMDVEDYFLNGRRWALRLREKGGKLHMVPAHHSLIEYLGDYLDESGLSLHPRAPLFQSLTPRRQLSGRRLYRHNVYHMTQRKAQAAGLETPACCHTMRTTGITAYLKNGGSLEFARTLAAHESSQTTRLYDHSDDDLSLDEIERIRF